MFFKRVFCCFARKSQKKPFGGPPSDFDYTSLADC